MLINVPGAIFYTTTMQYIANKWIMYVIICLEVLSTVTMLMTALMDPGIIPKAYWDKEAKN